MCRKRPLEGILADLILARNSGKNNPQKRFECRKYYCKHCSNNYGKSMYHLTSEGKKL